MKLIRATGAKGAHVSHIRRTAQQWRGLIEAQARSGLSIAAFCRREGLCAGSMDNWRRRLREEVDVSVPVEQTAPTFVELSDPRAAPAGGVKLRLDLGGGMVLELTRL
jgi:transposase-like protein